MILPRGIARRGRVGREAVSSSQIIPSLSALACAVALKSRQTAAALSGIPAFPVHLPTFPSSLLNGRLPVSSFIIKIVGKPRTAPSLPGSFQSLVRSAVPLRYKR
jgi:hypothetical protein